MKITLSPDLERRIAEELNSGRYRSADELIRAGLELLQSKESALPEENSKDSGSIDDAFSAIAGDVPETEWRNVPADLSTNLDHYLYGSTKTAE